MRPRGCETNTNMLHIVNVATTGVLCASLPVCWPLITRGTGFLRLSNFSNLKASDRVRSWWQTHRCGRASRVWFSGTRSKHQGELAPGSNEGFPLAAAQAVGKAAPYATPLLPEPEHRHIRVGARVDVELSPQVHCISNTSRIPGQHYYNLVSQVERGGPYGRVYTDQGADGRVYWSLHNTV